MVELWKVKGRVHAEDRANLMNPAFTEMGAAVAVNSRSAIGMYWAQEFGTRR